MKKHELLATVRGVADKVSVQEKDRCVSEGVDCLAGIQEGNRGGKNGELQRIVKYFVDHNLTLLTSDKEGGFVVLPNETFGEKASAAIRKHFKPAGILPKKAKTSAVKKLNELNLESLAKAVKNSDGLELKSLFRCEDT
ncbi:hypothetical protein HPB48_022151 [Haemaphysalis longicornis]|uniref:Uncharacterized protein n=1 Tax=Haemaphysalis longicornis TaxID=44386 RepID=A0A9J6FMC0_HAELO|nr:hypothetical protein HPB48_022151 [Haemaphysalis longicornis]